ncbi:protease inhibitor I42 family protein [Sinomonas cyclohexanicum]|nr:protease inhibitor I42 family protein [Corynebacterium cyclohexanicum]
MDTEGSVEVVAGHEFTVTLRLAGGTGYRWECTRVPEGIVVVRALPRVPDGPLPGAAASQDFVLRATGTPGRTSEVHFALRRPWEEAPAARHTERVTIAPGPITGGDA